MHRMRTNLAAALLAAAALSLVIGSAGAASAAPAPTPRARAEAAYQALGGDRLLAVKTTTVKATMQQWDPGESYSLSDLTSPDGGTSTFTRSRDYDRVLSRTEWVRPRAGGGNRTFTEIVTPNAGYVIGNDANGPPTRRATQTNPPQHTMSGVRLTATMRELERPLIVPAMHQNPDRVSASNDQIVNGKTYPAVRYRGDHGTFIVILDPSTNLPVSIRTRDWDQLMGDASFDAVLSDWREIAGIKVAYRTSYFLNRNKVWETTIDDLAVNPTLSPDTFAVPAPLQGVAAPRPAAPEKTPFQWILRRVASGFFLDADALYTDDGASLVMNDIAPNISHVTGGTHHNLVVATPRYLVAFEAPNDDAQSQWVIDAAKKKYPGRNFRYLVLTHHHIDHSGGYRAFIADGATLVVGKGDGDYFRKSLAARQTLNYARPKGALAPRVIEVDGKWSVNDGGRTVEAYLIDTPHAGGYLIPYVPDAKLGFVTDIWGPGGPLPATANPNLISVVRGMEKWKLTPERFAGGHGAVGNYADLARLVGPAR